MRKFVAVALMSIAVYPVLAGEADEKALQGTWSATIVEAGGKPAGDKFKDVKFSLIIKGNMYTTLVDNEKIEAGTFKLDAAQKIKTIDVMPSEGEFKGKTLKGLYEIKGDEMRVIFATPDSDRPKDFKTRDKTEDVLLSYKRAKDKK